MVGLFKKKYRTVPEKYMRTLSLGDELEVRNLVSDDDGEFDTLNVYALGYDEWGDFRGVGIQINGETVFENEQIYGYESDMYLYRNDINETTFIIIHLVQDSEDDDMFVLAIGDDGIVTETESEYYGISPVSIINRYGEEEWDNDYSYKTLFDPDGFLALTRNDVLGTNFETGKYCINDEGRIERISKYLDFSSGFELTLKQDFKAGMIDPEHMFNEDSDVPGEFDIVRSGAVDIIIIDSVAALVPKAEIEGDMGDSHVGLQARLMSQALRKLTGVVSRTNCIVVFINQLREKVGVMFGNPETTTGGRALKFYSSVRMDVRRIDSIKSAGEVIGNLR